MAVKFKGPGVTKQDRLIIAPNQAIAFDDDGAEEYFVAIGWAENTDDEPIFTYPEGSVNIDPETVFADGPKKGQLVMPHRSKTAAPKKEEA